MMTSWLKSVGVVATLSVLATFTGIVAGAQSRPITPLRIMINSAEDGSIQPDGNLTLREAIALTNGELSADRLSPQEQKLVQAASHAEILFDLPPDHRTIYLKSALPPLRAVGLSLDGTSQPGYGKSADVFRPLISITPEQGTEILQGLTVMADRVAIRGLSLYGFTQTHDKHSSLASLLPADILITRQIPNQIRTGDHTESPVQGVMLEHNWLGVMTEGSVPAKRSDFGIWIYNGSDALIRNNYIANHGGSGILTSVNAEKTLINGNRIEHNGETGMPDAIRLSGNIGGTELIANRISESGGSAIYLFKPEGSISIEENQLVDNGRRVQQAAIVLMGSGHQILENTVESQPGPGILVAAYPLSNRILIKGNHFSKLKGLSIDLLSHQHTEVSNYLTGDGPNPNRDSSFRRLDTGNGSINAPEFLSNKFYLQGDAVNLDGKVDPEVTVAIYKVTEAGEDYGPLSEPLTTVQADKKGRFGLTLTGLKAGDRLSAIATHPIYGTSEPALNTEVR